MVNLIDQRGPEATLYRALSSQLYSLKDPQLHLYNWDFHQHCRKMQWHNVSLLMEDLEKDLGEIGCFEVRLGDAVPVVNSQQRGVIRTNCMDCLDRTNVVQSEIARRHLTATLHSWSHSHSHSRTDTTFKNLWADNADAISRQYSGTGALKTDFTRTGRRTRLGMLTDLLKSIVRYVRGNVLDADRQDGMDILFGKVRARVGGVLWLAEQRRQNYIVLVPLALLLLLSYFALSPLIGTASSSSGGSTIGKLAFSALSLLLMALVVKTVLAFGSVFARLPRLQPVVPSVRYGRARPTPGVKAHVI
jgi:hypothetical protein